MRTKANHVASSFTNSEVDHRTRAAVDLAGIVLISMNYSTTLVVLNPCCGAQS
jgi:TRAP-type mannitol/chloroaromatic compound transport system permease small subunit